jgi:hypothetical protein
MNAWIHGTGLFDVSCMLCGRVVGELVGSDFHANPRVKPPTRAGRRVRCGECGGNLYLEPVDAPAMLAKHGPTGPVRAARVSAA